MRILTTVVLVLIVHLCIPAAQSQEVAAGSKDFRNTFEDIQLGFETGRVSVFSPYLGSQVHVSLKGEESGYYSANHAFYIIENFLKVRKVVSFEFTSIGETEAMPYATGRAVFNFKGTREITQVYAALMKSGERWVITEINIY